MELLTVISLICGLNLGNAQVDHKSIEIVIDKKRECQVKLAQCLTPKGMFASEFTLIECLGKQ
jgi:hypothetical protein